MKLKLLLFFLFVSVEIFSQDYIFGKITTEDHVEISKVTVINLMTEEQTVSDAQGHYMIRAAPGQELRFTKQRYERVSVQIRTEHLTKPVNVVLQQIPQEIEEVEINYQPTGNLKEDAKHFGDRGKVKVMKDDVANYVAKKSDRTVLAPKHGEFVQPVGKGFSIGKVKKQWDDVDFMQFLIKELGEEFFTQDLKLTKPEIQPFIFFVFRYFERKNILLYGNATSSDVLRFMSAAENKIESYRRPR